MYLSCRVINSYNFGTKGKKFLFDFGGEGRELR